MEIKLDEGVLTLNNSNEKSEVLKFSMISDDDLLLENDLMELRINLDTLHRIVNIYKNIKEE